MDVIDIWHVLHATGYVQPCGSVNGFTSSIYCDVSVELPLSCVSKALVLIHEADIIHILGREASRHQENWRTSSSISTCKHALIDMRSLTHILSVTAASSSSLFLLEVQLLYLP